DGVLDLVDGARGGSISLASDRSNGPRRLTSDSGDESPCPNTPLRPPRTYPRGGWGRRPRVRSNGPNLRPQPRRRIHGQQRRSLRGCGSGNKGSAASVHPLAPTAVQRSGGADPPSLGGPGALSKGRPRRPPNPAPDRRAGPQTAQLAQCERSESEK